MNSEIDFFPELTALVRQVLEDHLNPNTLSLLSMMSEDIVFEFPYALPGGLPEVSGKPALADYLSQIANLISIKSMTLDNVVIDGEGKQVVLEISCLGTGKATGLPYNQHYVCVLTLYAGLIQRWRDYWNPIVILQTIGGIENLSEIVKKTKND